MQQTIFCTCFSMFLLCCKFLFHLHLFLPYQVASLLAMLCGFHLTSFSKFLCRSCLVNFSLIMYFRQGGIFPFVHLQIILISIIASSSSNLSMPKFISLVFVCCFLKPILDQIILISFFLVLLDYHQVFLPKSASNMLNDT